MSMYRREWDCCNSVTETDAWEPESCPFCTDSAPSVASGAQELIDDALSKVSEIGTVGAMKWLAVAIAAQAKPQQIGALPALPWQTKENGGDLAAWLEARSDTEIANEFSEYGQECYLQAIANSAPNKALVEQVQILLDHIDNLSVPEGGQDGYDQLLTAASHVDAALKAAGVEGI